jgi:hypothetical protein
VLEGSAGLCGGALTIDAPLPVSFLPNRHQLLPVPDWHPVKPTIVARSTAKRAWENRIARAPCASLGKERAQAASMRRAGSRSLP